MERRESGPSLAPALTRRSLQEHGPTCSLSLEKTIPVPDAVGTQSTQCEREQDMHQVSFPARSEVPPCSENCAEKMSGSTQPGVSFKEEVCVGLEH